MAAVAHTEGEGQVATALPVNHENNELILRLFAKYAGVEDGVPLPDSCRIEHSKYVSIGVQNPIWDQLQVRTSYASRVPCRLPYRHPSRL